MDSSIKEFLTRYIHEVSVSKWSENRRERKRIKTYSRETTKLYRGWSFNEAVVCLRCSGGISSKTFSLKKRKREKKNCFVFFQCEENENFQQCITMVGASCGIVTKTPHYYIRVIYRYIRVHTSVIHKSDIRIHRSNMRVRTSNIRGYIRVHKCDIRIHMRGHTSMLLVCTRVFFHNVSAF